MVLKLPSNDFLQRYLETVAQRIINIAVMISFLFWSTGVTYEVYNFTGSVFDIILISAGIMSTILLILFPNYRDISELLKEKDIVKARRDYLSQMCDTLHYFGLLWTWAGLVTFIAQALFNSDIPYGIVSNTIGILGICILIFCPTEEHFS